MMRKTRFIAIAVMSAVVAGGATASATERTLKTAFFIPTSKSLFRQAFDDFVAKTNELGKGSLQVPRILSRESVPARQMPTAVKNGVLELLGAPPGYWERLIPGSSGLSAPLKSRTEQHANGAWKLAQEKFAAKAGAHLLAQYGFGVRFHLFMATPIRRLADFKNVKIRVSPTTRAFVAAIGAQPIVMSRKEIFTAMERGVVQGFSNLNSEIKALGWGDVVKYRIDPSFYDTIVFVVVNKKAWDGLNANQRKVLTDAGDYLETTLNKRLAAHDIAIGQEQIKAGVFKAVSLPANEAKRYVDMAYKGTWDTVVERSPDFGGKLRALIGR